MTDLQAKAIKYSRAKAGEIINDGSMNKAIVRNSVIFSFTGLIKTYEEIKSFAHTLNLDEVIEITPIS